MTQKEKQLLLKELCMRIPYRTFVCLNPGAYNKPEKCWICGISGEDIYLNVDSDPFSLHDFNIFPYLRPTSNMTEEEEKEFEETLQYTQCTLESYDWLLTHHFDFRGLIEQGLALEAPKGMYVNV